MVLIPSIVKITISIAKLAIIMISLVSIMIHPT
jgi:hypothetical protein